MSYCISTQHFTHVGSLAAQIFITIMLKEKGAMQTSRLADATFHPCRITRSADIYYYYAEGERSDADQWLADV